MFFPLKSMLYKLIYIALQMHTNEYIALQIQIYFAWSMMLMNNCDDSVKEIIRFFYSTYFLYVILIIFFCCFQIKQKTITVWKHIIEILQTNETFQILYNP